MNNASFRRKLVYIGAIVALLIPVYFLGQPMIQRKGETVGQGGGTLAKIRQKYSIGQADLGEIDPASESMRLATLGFRGFATTILWHKADYYKREQFWDRYSATLNQIALLQPHFINVWDHQAHNLTYNIAVEFDGYKQRYEWVKKGIDYLIRGTTYNKRQPILEWTLGIYTGQKIGVADEKRQYRELYRKDDEYHKHLIAEGLDVKQSDALGADGRPDHWLSGRLWFNKAYDLVDAGYYCKKSPHLLYSDGPKCILRYSEAIEEEGILDDRAQFAWSRGGSAWREFGNRDLMTTWGHPIKMKGDAAASATVQQIRDEFLAKFGDTYKGLLAKIRASLGPDEQAAFDLPSDKRTPEQHMLLGALERQLEPSPLEIAEATPANQREEALEMASRYTNAAEFYRHLISYRDQVNYAYWETRAVSEQHKTTLAARQQMHNANKLLQEAKMTEAIAELDKAWVNWARVFRRFPGMMDEDVAKDLVRSIKRYKQFSEGLPENFPLAKFFEMRLAKEQHPEVFEDTSWLTKMKKDAESLPESDDDLPAHLNDIGNAPMVEATAPVPSQTEPSKGEKESPRVNSPDAGAPPEPTAGAAPTPVTPPPAPVPSASAPAAPGRPPQLENPQPLN